MSCTNESELIKLYLIDKYSYNKISDKELKHDHLGLVIIVVKGLHRENLDVKASVYLYDKLNFYYISWGKIYYPSLINHV